MAAQYNPPGYIYTDPNGTAYTISAGGNLQSINDRSGNGLTITANGITSTTGLNVPFVRDAQNRITQITDPQGNIYPYGYDGNGNLATVTYPDTRRNAQHATPTHSEPTCILHGGTDARCNPLPSPLTMTAPTTTATPRSTGACQRTDAFSNTTSYAYDPVDHQHHQRRQRSQHRRNHHHLSGHRHGDDGLRQLWRSAQLHRPAPAHHHQRLRRQPQPDLGHRPAGPHHHLTYDTNGNKTSSTYPATATSNNTTSITAYNQYSEPTQTTDELGNVRLFNYDANYNPQSVTDSIGTLASFLFNPNQTLAGRRHRLRHQRATRPWPRSSPTTPTAT